MSFKMKMMLLPFLIQRDDGFKCFYCKNELKINAYVYEHLNNNRNDNRMENIVLACHSCNHLKENNFDMQISANEKLQSNEQQYFLGERNYEYSTTKETSTEIEINVSNFDLVRQFLSEIINTDGKIEFSNALNSCVYLCKEKTGHGSQQSIRNYLSTLTSQVAPFMIALDDSKKKIIVRRTGN